MKKYMKDWTLILFFIRNIIVYRSYRYPIQRKNGWNDCINNVLGFLKIHLVAINKG